MIRSLGSWTEVLSLRRRGEKQAYDQRILGDDEFIQGVLSEMNGLVKESLRLRSKRKDLSSLAVRCVRYIKSLLVNCDPGAADKRL